MRWLVFWGAIWASGCGGDCAPSADIQVTVAANAGVPVAQIALLRFALSVNGGQTKTYDLNITSQHPLTGSSAVLLRPNPAPASRYTITVTVTAYSVSGTMLAIGSDTNTVTDHGCNRLVAHLVGLPGGDMPDLSTGDGGGPADLGACFGALPDEDNDGRANWCDLCPADYDPMPTDTDGDGLPDACDPDPTTPTNHLLYFDPFDVATGHWSPLFPINNSAMDLITGSNNVLSTTNNVDPLPTTVRLQTFFVAPSVSLGANFADVGMELTDNMGNGILCRASYHNGSPDSLDMVVVANFVPQTGAGQSASTQITFPFGAVTRLRFTRRGPTAQGTPHTCEMAANGQTPASLSVTANNPPTTAQFVTLRASNVEAHFNSVVVESALP